MFDVKTREKVGIYFRWNQPIHLIKYLVNSSVSQRPIKIGPAITLLSSVIAIIDRYLRATVSFTVDRM